MITFFRNLRQKHLNGNRVAKYLLYAVGEIALVMIGILLALQVNTWNQGKENRVTERQYLERIKNDLELDMKQFAELDTHYRFRLGIFKTIDPEFDFIIDSAYRSSFTESAPFTPNRLFSRSASFRPANGTYRSLIANGESKLLRNKDLFNQIQTIYDMEHGNISSLYETIKLREGNLIWKYAKEFRYFPYSSTSDVKDPMLIADLNYFYQTIRLYYEIALYTKDKEAALISEISEELQKL